MSDATLSQLSKGTQEWVASIVPGMAYRITGVPFESTKLEEWAEFKNLSLYGRPSRKHDRAQIVYLEIQVYSLDATMRMDRNFNRVWEIAELYNEAVSQARITIENTCIQFREARHMYLDLRSLGDFTTGMNQQSPRLNLQCISIGCEGQILKTKE